MSKRETGNRSPRRVGAPKKAKPLTDGVRQIVYLSPKAHRALRLAAANEKVPSSVIAEKAILEYAERNPIVL